jgi:hypothetical protein
LHWKMIKPETDIELLDKNFLPKVKEFLRICVPKYGIFVTETKRSAARQKELIKTGASKRDRSLHQDGKAVDIAFLGEELYPKDMKRWEEVAKVARSLGIDWGYDLWKWDEGHLQDNGIPFLQNTMTELQKKSTEAIISILSASWLVFNGIPEKQEKIAKMAAEMREWK